MFGSDAGEPGTASSTASHPMTTSPVSTVGVGRRLLDDRLAARRRSISASFVGWYAHVGTRRLHERQERQGGETVEVLIDDVVVNGGGSAAASCHAAEHHDAARLVWTVTAPGAGQLHSRCPRRHRAAQLSVAAQRDSNIPGATGTSYLSEFDQVSDRHGLVSSSAVVDEFSRAPCTERRCHADGERGSCAADHYDAAC